jgi:hypothetical protein
MAVNVSVKALIASYVDKRGAAAETGESASALLLFYAVECGLKAAVLRRAGQRSSADLPQHLYSHDLRSLIKELRLPQQFVLTSCRLRASSNRLEPTEWHQAWRYGATLDAEDEKRAVAALKSLSDWCRKEHSR